MNLKHLMIVSLILAILTLGVVSASEDIAGNDTLSQSDTDDVPIGENAENQCESVASQQIDEEDEDVLSCSDDEPLIEANKDSKDPLGYYSSGGVRVEVYNYVDLTDPYSSLACVEDEDGIKGTVTLTIDGKKVFSKKYTKNKYYLSFGNNNIDLKNLGYGYHTVKLTYDDGNVKSDTRNVNFVAIPTVRYQDRMSVGENNGISITGENMDGSSTLFNRVVSGNDTYGYPIYKKGDAIITVNITNGYGWIPLDKLINGTHNLQLEYTFGTYEDVQTFSITVQENSAGFKSSLSKTTITFGKSITAKLTGPKGEGNGYIYIDNQYYKSDRFNFGKLEEVITDLSVGKHRITIAYYDYDSDLFYSKTYDVVVNHAVKLKLQKASVKKSAKKLVIKATLKIDGKAVKNKKLTFKFNNKKYTAKTDKNGVAKITIKKSMLKKLKKGKKIKYQVTYAKKTVIQKVKVKK